jgi:hypothetical protein
VWVDLFPSKVAPAKSGFPPFEPIDLRKVADDGTPVPSPEARLRGTDPGPAFGPAAGAFHPLVVASPDRTPPLHLP